MSVLEREDTGCFSSLVADFPLGVTQHYTQILTLGQSKLRLVNSCSPSLFQKREKKGKRPFQLGEGAELLCTFWNA